MIADKGPIWSINGISSVNICILPPTPLPPPSPPPSNGPSATSWHKEVIYLSIYLNTLVKVVPSLSSLMAFALEAITLNALNALTLSLSC